MLSNRLVGIGLVVIGVVLLAVGMNASHSVADRWTNFFAGHFTDATVWYLVVGGAAAILGLLLTMLGGRKSTL